MKFASLFSGSSGNCLYVSHKKTALLIDAGLSGKRIEKALTEINAASNEINGILVTHEHMDHIQGVGVLSRRYDLPIYATYGTWKGMLPFIGKIAERNQRIIQAKGSFDVNDFHIIPFSLSHDAQDPIGFVIDSGSTSVAMATDTGTLTPTMKQQLLGHDLVVLESNHDVSMLETGPYPFPLKKRIKSDFGHLSNATASDMAVTLAKSGVKHLLLAHLSAENNMPLLAYTETEQKLKAIGATPGKDIQLEVAKRDQHSSVFQLQ